MRIRMLAERTGTRYDGQDWPPAGGEITVPDEEAVALFEHGLAVPVVTDAVEIPEQPDPAVELRAAPGVPETLPEAAPEAVPETVPQDAADEAVPQPIVNAPKAVWVDFAASKGFDRSVAGSMTKADLIARFKDFAGSPPEDT